VRHRLAVYDFLGFLGLERSRMVEKPWKSPLDNTSDALEGKHHISTLPLTGAPIQYDASKDTTRCR
jgi:BRCT domain type II-containing protein